MNFWILAAASSGCSSYLCSNSVCAGICWDYLVCCRVEFALRWCEMMSKYTGSPCRVKQRLIGGLASGAQYWSFDWLLNWSRFVTRLSLPPPRVPHHCLPPNQSELPRPRGSLALPLTQHHALCSTPSTTHLDLRCCFRLIVLVLPSVHTLRLGRELHF